MAKSFADEQYEVYCNLINGTGKKYSQLELEIYDINANVKEIDMWRKIARHASQTPPLNSNPKHLPTITFKTK